MASSILISEPQAQRDLEAAHWVDGNGKTELRTVDNRVPAREDTMVEQVGCIHPGIQIEGRARTERPCKRTIQVELVGAGNRVPACHSPLAGWRRGIGGNVEVQPPSRCVDGRAGTVWTDRAGESCSGDGVQIDRTFRQARSNDNLCKNSPAFEKPARPPGHQGSTAKAFATRVLDLRIEEVALIKARKRALGVQIKPILCDGRGWSGSALSWCSARC